MEWRRCCESTGDRCKERIEPTNSVYRFQVLLENLSQWRKRYRQPRYIRWTPFLQISLVSWKVGWQIQIILQGQLVQSQIYIMSSKGSEKVQPDIDPEARKPALCDFRDEWAWKACLMVSNHLKHQMKSCLFLSSRLCWISGCLCTTLFMMRQLHEDKVVSGNNLNGKRGWGEDGCRTEIKSNPSTSAVGAADICQNVRSALPLHTGRVRAKR